MFDLSEHTRLLAEVDAANTNHEKGQRFETLACSIFEALDGVEVSERNATLPAEEIDIVLWNTRNEEVLVPWDHVILVECKNWSKRVDAQPLEAFVGKVRRRSLTTAIFVAANGVTGDFADGNGSSVGAKRIIEAALQDGIRVIVLTLDDLRNVTSVDDFRAVIRNRFCGIYVSKVF